MMDCQKLCCTAWTWLTYISVDVARFGFCFPATVVDRMVVALLLLKVVIDLEAIA